MRVVSDLKEEARQFFILNTFSVRMSGINTTWHDFEIN
jgi:hypothetical protein